MLNNKTKHTKAQHLECVGSYIVNWCHIDE